MSAEEKKAVGALLKTAQGVARQDAQAQADISVYINKARGLGIVDPNALVYYADIYHQVGSGAIKKYGVKAAELSGGYDKITLKTLYQAALIYATTTKSRRTKVYNMLVADPVEGSAEETPKLPESVSISPSDAQVLYLGNTLNLTADVSPTNAKATCDWSTSSESVAQVAGGVVTPQKRGNGHHHGQDAERQIGLGQGDREAPCGQERVHQPVGRADALSWGFARPDGRSLAVRR